MPSTIGSRTSRGQRFDHTINISVVENPDPITYERTVTKGQKTDGFYKISGYKTQPIGLEGIPVQRVSTYQEYIAGCSCQKQCLGHFCITPRGTVLLPQKLASTVGLMSNDFAKMAENVFSRDTGSQEEEYRAKLKELMQGKHGKMRGNMPSGPVDGSTRLVLSQCWQMPPGYVALPRMVAYNMRVLRIPRDKETGLPLGHYVEDRVRQKETEVKYIFQDGHLFVEEEVVHEGDYHIGVRPPSLWAGNVQPLKVVLWDHECTGVSPSNVAEYHADHDGDEFHTYNITTEEAIEQCKGFKQLSECIYEKAVRSVVLPEQCYSTPPRNREKFHNYLGLREKFMVHSTLSIRELQDGVPLTELSKVSRLKEPMVNMGVEMLRNPDKVFGKYYKEGIRGIKDVMAQRCPQGALGDMTRQAKLAASCVRYKGNGIFEIKTTSGTVRSFDPELQNTVSDFAYPLGGNPCIRAVSLMCAVAQQAALDSHRVSQEVNSSMDLINNFIMGGKETLVVFNGTINVPCTWKYIAGSNVYAILSPESAILNITKIVGSYNPIVLNAVKSIDGNIKEVCKNGIAVVCNYYNVKLSLLELSSLAELMCFECGASSIPITNKSGIKKRNIRWLVKVFSDHYGLIFDLQNRRLTKDFVVPETTTEAASFANFSFM
jgi:hypothetical protein